MLFLSLLFSRLNNPSSLSIQVPVMKTCKRKSNKKGLKIQIINYTVEILDIGNFKVGNFNFHAVWRLKTHCRNITHTCTSPDAVLLPCTSERSQPKQRLNTKLRQCSYIWHFTSDQPPFTSVELVFLTVCMLAQTNHQVIRDCLYADLLSMKMFTGSGHSDN